MLEQLSQAIEPSQQCLLLSHQHHAHIQTIPPHNDELETPQLIHSLQRVHHRDMFKRLRRHTPPPPYTPMHISNPSHALRTFYPLYLICILLLPPTLVSFYSRNSPPGPAGRDCFFYLPPPHYRSPLRSVSLA